MNVNVLGPFTTVMDCGPCTVSPSGRYRALRDSLNLDHIAHEAGVYCDLWGIELPNIVVRKHAILYPRGVMSMKHAYSALLKKGCRPADQADLLCFISARHHEPGDGTIIAPKSLVDIPLHNRWDLVHRSYLAYEPRGRRRRLVTIEESEIRHLNESDGVLFQWGEDHLLN